VLSLKQKFQMKLMKTAGLMNFQSKREAEEGVQTANSLSSCRTSACLTKVSKLFLEHLCQQRMHSRQPFPAVVGIVCADCAQSHIMCLASLKGLEWSNADLADNVFPPHQALV
jgi:hypothetical protein